jgi:hypothetical protein
MLSDPQALSPHHFRGQHPELIDPRARVCDLHQELSAQRMNACLDSIELLQARDRIVAISAGLIELDQHDHTLERPSDIPDGPRTVYPQALSSFESVSEVDITAG